MTIEEAKKYLLNSKIFCEKEENIEKIVDKLHECGITSGSVRIHTSEPFFEIVEEVDVIGQGAIIFHQYESPYDFMESSLKAITLEELFSIEIDHYNPEVGDILRGLGLKDELYIVTSVSDGKAYLNYDNDKSYTQKHLEQIYKLVSRAKFKVGDTIKIREYGEIDPKYIGTIVECQYTLDHKRLYKANFLSVGSSLNNNWFEESKLEKLEVFECKDTLIKLDGIEKFASGIKKFHSFKVGDIVTDGCEKGTISEVKDDFTYTVVFSFENGVGTSNYREDQLRFWKEPKFKKGDEVFVKLSGYHFTVDEIKLDNFVYYYKTYKSWINELDLDFYIKDGKYVNLCNLCKYKNCSFDDVCGKCSCHNIISINHDFSNPPSLYEYNPNNK